MAERVKAGAAWALRHRRHNATAPLPYFTPRTAFVQGSEGARQVYCRERGRLQSKGKKANRARNKTTAFETRRLRSKWRQSPLGTGREGPFSRLFSRSARMPN